MTFMKSYCRETRDQFMTIPSYSFMVYKYNSSARIIANNLSCSGQSELLHLFDFQGNLSLFYHYFSHDLAKLSFFILSEFTASIYLDSFMSSIQLL